MSDHQVVTKDYPENLSRGVMICGINFGFSTQDEANELSGVPAAPSEKSFFSDISTSNYPYANRLLKWFSFWGVDLKRHAGEEGGIERSFFLTNWLDTQSRNVNDVVKIDHELLVENAAPLLQLIAERKPRLIVFCGSMLIQAINDIRIRSAVETVLGSRPGNATAHRIAAGVGRKFSVWTQAFPEVDLLCLPHPTGTRGLTDHYMEGFADIISPMLKGSRFANSH